MSAVTGILEQSEVEVDRLLEKAGLYRLFSQLFASPSPRCLLQDIAEHNLLTTACHFHEAPGEFRRLEADEWPANAEEIAVEFTSLFSAPGAHYVPPYDSFYVDELQIESAEDAECGISFREGRWKGYIGQHSASVVRALYARAGLELSPAFHDLPDHLAAELEFLAHLTVRQASALRQGLSELAASHVRQAEDFRRCHLDRWGATFLARVKANPVSIFYRQVAAGLDGFLTGNTAAGTTVPH